MSATHSHRASQQRYRKLDLAGLALLLCGVIFGVLAYWLIAERDVSSLVLIPSVVAATVGASHLFKWEVP